MAKDKDDIKSIPIRVVVCKECKRQIDEMGCIAGCKYDTNPRSWENMEYWVYEFARIEPYSESKSKK